MRWEGPTWKNSRVSRGCRQTSAAALDGLSHSTASTASSGSSLGARSAAAAAPASSAAAGAAPPSAAESAEPDWPQPARARTRAKASGLTTVRMGGLRAFGKARRLPRPPPEHPYALSAFIRVNPRPGTPSQRSQRSVEGGAGAHGGGGLGGVGAVVAADVDRLALDAVELGDDLRLVLGQGLGQRGELRLQSGVLVLPGQGLRPAQGQGAVAAAVVQAAEPARRRAVLVEDAAVGLVQGPGQHAGAGMAVA